MGQSPEQIAGKLKQIKGEDNQKWGRLSDRELLKIKQRRAILVDKMQKKSGHTPKDTLPTE